MLDGGSLNVSATDSADSASIANVGGQPWVAFDGNVAGNFPVYVVAWNGSSWSQVGNVGNVNAYNLTNPALASVGGVPYLAWAESPHSNQAALEVDSWNGSSWVAAGGAVDSALGGIQSSPSLGDLGGQP